MQIITLKFTASAAGPARASEGFAQALTRL